MVGKVKIEEGIRNYLSRLIDERMKEGQSITALAKMADLDKSTVSRWHDKITSPKLVEAFHAIEKWGGTVAEAMRDAGGEALAAIVSILEDDKDARDALAKILASDHPVKDKLLRDIKDYSEMIKQ